MDVKKRHLSGTGSPRHRRKRAHLWGTAQAGYIQHRGVGDQLCLEGAQTSGKTSSQRSGKSTFKVEAESGFCDARQPPWRMQ